MDTSSLCKFAAGQGRSVTDSDDCNTDPSYLLSHCSFKALCMASLDLQPTNLSTYTSLRGMPNRITGWRYLAGRILHILSKAVESHCGCKCAHHNFKTCLIFLHDSGSSIYFCICVAVCVCVCVCVYLCHRGKRCKVLVTVIIVASRTHTTPHSSDVVMIIISVLIWVGLPRLRSHNGTAARTTPFPQLSSVTSSR